MEKTPRTTNKNERHLPTADQRVAADWGETMGVTPAAEQLRQNAEHAPFSGLDYTGLTNRGASRLTHAAEINGRTPETGTNSMQRLRELGLDAITITGISSEAMTYLRDGKEHNIQIIRQNTLIIARAAEKRTLRRQEENAALHAPEITTGQPESNPVISAKAELPPHQSPEESIVENNEELEEDYADFLMHAKAEAQERKAQRKMERAERREELRGAAREKGREAYAKVKSGAKRFGRAALRMVKRTGRKVAKGAAVAGASLRR